MCTIFRNVPLLIQLFIWFYVVPNFLPTPIKNWWMNDLGANTTALISASVGLGLFTAARVVNRYAQGLKRFHVVKPMRVMPWVLVRQSFTAT